MLNSLCCIGGFQLVSFSRTKWEQLFNQILHSVMAYVSETKFSIFIAVFFGFME